MHKAKFKHRPVRYRCDRVWEDKYDDAGAEDGKTRRRRDFLALFGLDATWKYDASQTEESKEEDDQSTSPLRSEILDNVFERATSDLAFSKSAKKTKRDARYRNIVDDNNTITVGAAKRMVKALKQRADDKSKQGLKEHETELLKELHSVDGSRGAVQVVNDRNVVTIRAASKIGEALAARLKDGKGLRDHENRMLGQLYRVGAEAAESFRRERKVHIGP